MFLQRKLISSVGAIEDKNVFYEVTFSFSSSKNNEVPIMRIVLRANSQTNKMRKLSLAIGDE